MGVNNMGALTKFIKVLIGIILIVLGLMSYVWWWPALWTVFKGGLGLMVIGIGLLVILIAFTE